MATDLLVALGAGFPSHDRSWGPWGSYGAYPVAPGKRMFRWWHRVRDGTIDRARFKTIAARLRREVKAAWKMVIVRFAKTAATCFEILKVEEGLWTFVRVEGIEPTNNGPGARCDMP